MLPIPTPLPGPNPSPSPARARVRACSIALALGLLAALPAKAVVLADADGTGNTTSPPDTPGFANVGEVNGLSGVYVRNGWVLTAGHVGEHPLVLAGETFTPFARSTVRFVNEDGSRADLIAFKLTTRPALPDLAITSAPPSRNASVTIIGNGRNRGPALSWMGHDGWSWGTGRTIRWGRNRISDVGELTLDTRSFWLEFDTPGRPGAEDQEADVATGDSGGAAFIDSGASAELAGIIFAHTTFPGQPANSSLFGNGAFVADLYAYREQILSVIDQPACSDGIDDDGDGLSDFPDDPGCSDPEDPDERGAVFECDNGIDDDGDDLYDFPEDDGCLHATNPVEAPEPGVGAALPIGIAALVWLSRPRGPRGSCRAARRTRASRSLLSRRPEAAP